MNLLNYLLTILILVVTGCGRKNVEKKDGNTRPNIIFILADDLGYMDIQEYAQHTLHTDKSDMFYETPNLDRLSKEGVSFSRAYANQLCSPTRAGILTGKYASRIGFTNPAGPEQIGIASGRERACQYV